MSIDRQQLARMATAKALQLRKRGAIEPWGAVCVFDLAERLGVDVRFIDIPSMEGAYCLAAHPTIIVSSLRPAGRQAFTGAHELGHHVFGHGDQYDELVDTRRAEAKFDPNEFVADCFAGAMLMPKLAVDHAFAVRGLDPSTCQPEHMYSVASYLGVGYATLIRHMQYALGALTQVRSTVLLRSTPQSLRSSLLGRECREPLVYVDLHWTGRAIDVQESDLILLPPDTVIEGRAAMVVEQSPAGTVVNATRPGISRASIPGKTWTAFIRVTRKSYVGRAKYRFAEEVSDLD